MLLELLGATGKMTVSSVPFAVTADLVGIKAVAAVSARSQLPNNRGCRDANAALPNSSRRLVTADQ